MSSKGYKILIVDADAEHAEALARTLAPKYPDPAVACSSEAAVEIIDNRSLDLLITEFDLKSSITGIDLLGRAKQKNPATSVIILTAHPSIEICKEAIRKGAFDYLAKPIDTKSLMDIISQALPGKRASTAADNFIFNGVISKSPAMQSVFHVLRRIAPTDITVLIEGPSGTGKELTAKAIHDNSKRKHKPFIPLNCAGIAETLLESELFGHVKGAFTGAAADRKGLLRVADQGTLFLDEIGDMPFNMQAKLLRVLEDGLVTPVGSNETVKVDVRVICATNHDLSSLVEQKKFRQDLYFRIKGVSLTLPPLRSRPEDIPELFGYFLKEACDQTDRDIHLITEPAMRILLGYDWPGNIRQLRNAVRTMVVMCDGDTIDVADLPPDIYQVRRLAGQTESELRMPIDFAGRSLQEIEKMHIAETLRFTSNNRAEAAKILKIGERTLYRKIKEYGL